MRFCFRAFVARSSSENRRKIVRRLMKIRAESSQNQRKIDLGLSWAPTAVSGKSPDALGTAYGRPNDAPRLILGRPGRGQERLGAIQKGSRTALETLQDPPGEPSERLWCTERRRTRPRINYVWVAFGLSRESSDVLRIPVFTMLCWVDQNLHETHASAQNGRKSHHFALQN